MEGDTSSLIDGGDTPSDTVSDPLDLVSMGTDNGGPAPIVPDIASGSDTNPSSGLDLGSLMSQLIGTAGTAYGANQQATAASQIAAANAAAISASNASNPLAIFSTTTGKDWLIIGAGILALALILRK